MEGEIIGESNVSSSTWLLLHEEEKACIFFYNLSEERYHAKSIPFLKDKVIRTYAYNWLLLEDAYENVFYLLNLVTMENLQLPPFEDDVNNAYRVCFVLTSPPASPDCHILVFFDSSVLFCQVGDAQFTKQKLDYLVRDAIVFQEKICYFVNDFEFVTIEFVPDSQELRVTPWINLDFKSTSIYPPEIRCPVPYYIPFRDELLFVCKMRPRLSDKEVWGFRVFQMDFEEKKWVRKKSIGEKTIFLGTSQTYGFCIEASSKAIKKNCIYFLNRDMCYCVFDLEDGGIETYLPCPLVSGKGDMYPSWAMINGIV